MAYNPFHKELYSGSQDCLIKAWDAQTGQLLRKQSGHGGWVTDVLFVPELKLLFSCSIDHTIRVWSDKGKQAQVIKNAQQQILNNFERLRTSVAHASCIVSDANCLQLAGS